MTLEFNGAAQLARENEILHALLTDASEVLHEIATAATYIDRDVIASHAHECLQRII